MVRLLFVVGVVLVVTGVLAGVARRVEDEPSPLYDLPSSLLFAVVMTGVGLVALGLVSLAFP